MVAPVHCRLHFLTSPVASRLCRAPLCGVLEQLVSSRVVLSKPSWAHPPPVTWPLPLAAPQFELARMARPKLLRGLSLLQHVSAALVFNPQLVGRRASDNRAIVVTRRVKPRPPVVLTCAWVGQGPPASLPRGLSVLRLAHSRAKRGLVASCFFGLSARQPAHFRT